MRLKDCTFGKVVYMKESDINSLNYEKPCVVNGVNLVGHIVGFSINCLNESTVKVEWNNGRGMTVHPSLLIEASTYESNK